MNSFKEDFQGKLNIYKDNDLLFLDNQYFKYNYYFKIFQQ